MTDDKEYKVKVEENLPVVFMEQQEILYIQASSKSKTDGELVTVKKKTRRKLAGVHICFGYLFLVFLVATIILHFCCFVLGFDVYAHMFLMALDSVFGFFFVMSCTKEDFVFKPFIELDWEDKTKEKVEPFRVKNPSELESEQLLEDIK